uniref:DNAJC9 HTH domain-containing protein n=1 Tax=Cannabis sativa TaxID=3483 RepID=A0A803QM05_CANSA
MQQGSWWRQLPAVELGLCNPNWLKLWELERLLARRSANSVAHSFTRASYFFVDRTLRSNDVSTELLHDLVGDAVQNLHEFSEPCIERGTDSEKKDLIDLYNQFKGNMPRLFSSMLCSDPKLDSHRFKDIIDETIAAGELKSTKAYHKWAKKVSETKPPTSPLRRNRKKGKFDSMFSSLVSKYGGGGSSSEPSEQEFEAAQKKVESRRVSQKSERKS